MSIIPLQHWRVKIRVPSGKDLLGPFRSNDYWHITGQTEPEDTVQDVSGESKGGLYRGQAGETQGGQELSTPPCLVLSTPSVSAKAVYIRAPVRTQGSLGILVPTPTMPSGLPAQSLCPQ